MNNPRHLDGKARPFEGHGTDVVRMRSSATPIDNKASSGPPCRPMPPREICETWPTERAHIADRHSYVTCCPAGTYLRARPLPTGAITPSSTSFLFAPTYPMWRVLARFGAIGRDWARLGAIWRDWARFGAIGRDLARMEPENRSTVPAMLTRVGRPPAREGA